MQGRALRYSFQAIDVLSSNKQNEKKRKKKRKEKKTSEEEPSGSCPVSSFIGERREYRNRHHAGLLVMERGRTIIRCCASVPHGFDKRTRGYSRNESHYIVRCICH
jgi:hypothetical protein